MFLCELGFVVHVDYRRGAAFMFVGYARVSTTDQNLDLQQDALLAAKCERIFTDTTSGAKTQRPGLTEALQCCRPGDTLVVWKLDRLGRSLPHLVETVRDLVAREVGFKSLQENIDTTSSGGKLIFHIFASLAEFERDIILERTQAGLSSARARGRKGGRPKGVDEKKQKAALALKNDPRRSVKEICDILGISRNTYYKYIKQEATPSGDPQKTQPPGDNANTPASKTMKVELCLQVENNNKFVRGKSKVRNEIEQFILSQFDMKKLNNGCYILSIPYASDEELDGIIYGEIVSEAEHTVDRRNCFIEADIVSMDDPERSW
jgi:DNA invertase Pin-like site-specific DNA recombinase